MRGLWSDLFFWVEFVLLIAAAAVIIWRRLYREFPLLLMYFCVEISASIVRRAFLLYSRAPVQYFYAYWASEAFIVVTSFVALYEVFLIRLIPSFHSTPVYKYLFPAASVLAVLIAVLVFIHAPHHGADTLAVIVGESNLTLNVLQAALLLFFFLIVLGMGRGWEWHEFGIALGFGVYALTKLVTYAVRAKAGYARTSVDQLPVFGYFAALVIWLIYLSREYKRPDINIPTELVAKALSWNKLLRDVTGRRR